MKRMTQGLLVLTLTVAGAGGAAGQASFDACYVPTVGAIYLIKQTGLPSACLAQAHVQFTWASGGVIADGSVTTIKLADGAVTPAKLSFNPATQPELNAVTTALAASGTINTTTNPVDWTQLKNVPAGFADGVDGGGVTDHGVLTGLTDDDHPQYALVNGTRTTTNGFAVIGTFGTGSIPASGNAVRMMWYPGKAAFRAGAPSSTSWEDANVGPYSVAMGAATTAGHAATAMGWSTTAGFGATAMGWLSEASGNYSTALGYIAIADGGQSTALGNSTHASGVSATAMGEGTNASGDRSTAMGDNTHASGAYSTAMGFSTDASGVAASAMGYQTTAQAYGSLVIGRYNVITGSTGSWVATDPLFVAGNGAASVATSNALTLLKNGNMTIAGTLTQSSDLRYKEAIEPLDNALAGVLRLAPIYYRFRENTGHPTERRIGLGAQDVERIFPELVHRDSQGYLSVAYTDLAAVLVRAMQEQQARHETLLAEVAALRAELAALRAAAAIGGSK